MADGFTVDLWNAVARKAGLDYRIVVAPFHQILSAFENDEIDVMINLAHSAERMRFADFSIGYRSALVPAPAAPPPTDMSR